MLELMIGGANGKSAIITPSTYTPLPGDTVTVTVTTKGISSGETLYWSVLDESEVQTGFSAQSGYRSVTAGKIIFNIVMPVDSANDFKTFALGVALTAADAKSMITALAFTTNITIGKLTSPVGQFTMQVPSVAYEWVVPARVFKISGVILGGSGGGGSSGTTDKGGGGGGAGLLYFNDYPVKPGDKISIQAPNFNTGFTQKGTDGATAGNITVRHNGTAIVVVTGGVGGKATGGSGSRGSILGLNATLALYAVSRLGTNGSTGSDGGQGGYCGDYRLAKPTQLNESINGDSNRVWGGGGWGGTETGGVGLAGRVRFIWGEGRSYPDNALDATPVT